jgi:hypothetical protein
VEKSADERDPGPRTEKDDEENADANPGINAEIKAGVGKRQSGAGKRGKNVAESIGSR